MSRNMDARRKKCGSCERPVPDAYLCRRCGIELRDLLIGGNDQPGIVWYLARLRESAYGQSKLARAGSSRSTREGYALLSNQRAVKLVRQISATLALWEAHCEALRATHSHERPMVATGTPDRNSDRLEARRARFIAAHVQLIRRYDVHAAELHAEMLRYAKQSWSIINRPNDICCGPCPAMVVKTVEDEAIRGVVKIETRCGTLLYAEDGSAGVVCPSCRTQHNVEDLRIALREQVSDMLFSGPELLRLMETRLNDRMSKSTFYQLIRDGRLQARHTTDDGTLQYTYDDLCEAREKPKPTRKSNVKAS